MMNSTTFRDVLSTSSKYCIIKPRQGVPEGFLLLTAAFDFPPLEAIATASSVAGLVTILAATLQTLVVADAFVGIFKEVLCGIGVGLFHLGLKQRCLHASLSMHLCTVCRFSFIPVWNLFLPNSLGFLLTR